MVLDISILYYSEDLGFLGYCYRRLVARRKFLPIPNFKAREIAVESKRILG